MIIKLLDIYHQDGWYDERENLIGNIFNFDIETRNRYDGWASGHLQCITYVNESEEIQKSFDVYVLAIKYEELSINDYPEYYL